MKHRIRYYQRNRSLLCFFLRPYFRRVFALDESPFPQLPERFLLVGNHVTKYDPLLTLLLTRRFMFFVATEHLFSMGLVSKLIQGVLNPISRSQGGQAASTVMEILRRLKNEDSVGIFAEGNCSWNGETASFLPATGKMARASGVPLVTLRLQGYFAAPRWAFTKRKGPVRLNLVHIYQPEELKKMTPEEINAAIARDIYEDAYATQEAHPAPYPGKRLAEGLEFALLLCPRCHGLDTFRSRRDLFSCSCGFQARYDQWGFFNGEDLPFRSIRDWDRWQQNYLAGLPLEALPVPEDEEMQLLLIRDHKREKLTAGRLRLDSQGLRLGEMLFPL
ncbi:MAG: 1-acyl-sn-glycerol-3-phosphate acyltransferase, partial [Lachnospiraceae bacterium]|nr:1-acyl-sn-glycerol-3-phosphate acyltransferase [Lachnospiraceae bacterium]